jgi:hypothetical protein
MKKIDRDGLISLVEEREELEIWVVSFVYM